MTRVIVKFVFLYKYFVINIHRVKFISSINLNTKKNGFIKNVVFLNYIRFLKRCLRKQVRYPCPNLFPLRESNAHEKKKKKKRYKNN